MVKINTSKGKNDGVIDLRGSHGEKEREEGMEIPDGDPEFEVAPMEDEAQAGSHLFRSSPIREADIAELKTSENVRVKFDKFASLVAAHATKEFIEQSRDEDVIVSTNLLTDLANSGKSDDSKKIPMIFLIGIILGIGLTWILLK
ncbi:MAG: hypothetical protein WC285_04630 [Candidatus Gracilibacteria bacterium]|jgi:hypothetical protein